MLHPDFVILSGDIVDYGTSVAFATMRRMLTMLQVPIFIGPGNHDIDSKGGLSTFETYIAPKNYSVIFGPAHIVSLDVSNSWYVPQDQVTWLDNVLSLNKSLRIVFFHYPPLDTSGNLDLEGAGTELVRVINKRNVTLVLTGHIHRDHVLVINNTHYVITTTAGGTYPKGFYHGYRIITYENGVLTNYGYNENNSRAIPFEKMSVDWTPLPGTIDVGAKIKIVNNLHLEFNASFYVKLKKDIQSTYVVKNATLTNIRDGITSTVVYLLREIKEGDSITIRVHTQNPVAPTIVNIDFSESVGDYEAFSIVARVNNPVSGVERVELHYVLKTAEGLSPAIVRMSKSSESEYKASFSGFATGTNFTFYIVAYDYSGLSVKSDEYTIVIGESRETSSPYLLDIQLIAIIGIAIIAVTAVIFIVKRQRK
ncbi:MAG: metallophosphoesterase family protein [Candidatus Asgardarchaeia archaeon]